MSLALKSRVANKTFGTNVPNLDAIVQKLKGLNVLVLKGEQSKRGAVDAVEAFLKKNVQGPNRSKTLDTICAKAKMTRRTYNRWKEECENREEIGSAIYEAAEAAGITINASSSKNLADTKRLNPGCSPTEIVRKAMNAAKPFGAHLGATAEIPVDTRELLVKALNEHLEATQGNVESVLKIIRNSPIQRAELCRMCKEMADVKPA